MSLNEYKVRATTGDLEELIDYSETIQYLYGDDIFSVLGKFYGNKLNQFLNREVLSIELTKRNVTESTIAIPKQEEISNFMQERGLHTIDVTSFFTLEETSVIILSRMQFTINQIAEILELPLDTVRDYKVSIIQKVTTLLHKTKQPPVESTLSILLRK